MQESSDIEKKSAQFLVLLFVYTSIINALIHCLLHSERGFQALIDIITNIIWAKKFFARLGLFISVTYLPTNLVRYMNENIGNMKKSFRHTWGLRSLKPIKLKSRLTLVSCLIADSIRKWSKIDMESFFYLGLALVQISSHVNLPYSIITLRYFSGAYNQN